MSCQQEIGNKLRELVRPVECGCVGFLFFFVSWAEAGSKEVGI